MAQTRISGAINTRGSRLTIDEATVGLLSQQAWGVRRYARVLGKTSVGAAALDETSNIHVGCNIEHRFRSHDIHAETAAMAALVSAGGNRLVAITIVAERERFTPCGACLDWIFELGGPDCRVFFQGRVDGDVMRYTANALMPHYPM